MHATAFLKAPEKYKTGPAVILSGEVRYLKQCALDAVSRLVLGPENAEVGFSRFPGPEVDLATITDELLTVSMWGERRLVVVDDADEFVSRNRDRLQDYLKKPAKKSVLLLDMKSCPKNTRLARLVSKIGLLLECATMKGGELQHWISEQVQAIHGKQIQRDAARLLVELSGDDVGLLEQELEKLAAYVGDRAQISVQDVRRLVGGWKAEKTFEMTAAVRDGQIGVALAHLEKLLSANEPPMRIMGAIRYVFSKFAVADQLTRSGVSLNSALHELGVFPSDIGKSAAYLRRLGRSRVDRIRDWLLSAESNLKGSSRLSDQMELERLLVRLSGKD